ncbi:MAG: type II toxin-antitoxin system VapC family toxin [Thermodesulfobacteriota bacterium]|nr:type II toxin-antitoxin system VapC family toxin [Thermodesulfobacteriota bacterium]
MNGENALIDSNIIIYLSKQQISPDFIERFDGLFISVITYMEILGYDFDDPIEEEYIKRLLGLLTVLYIDQSVADTVIEIRKRKKIKLPDAIIAATAITQDTHLITRNARDFSDTGVRLIDPFQI